jgi:hypothetical protein
MQEWRLDGSVADCPEAIDGAIVLWWAALDDLGPSHLAESVHLDGQNPIRFRAVAIAGYPDPMRMVGYPERNIFYVFSCDADWVCISDLDTDSIENALEIAHEKMTGLSVSAQGDRRTSHLSG